MSKIPRAMNTPISLRCVYAKATRPTLLHPRRLFNSSRKLLDPPKYSNVPSRTPQQISPETPSHKITSDDFKPYTKEEIAELEKRYTPAQIAAIRAGEEAVDPEDLATQGAVREDPFALPYQEDDLSKIQPVIDKPIRAPEENYDPKMRFKNEDEIASEFADFIDKLPAEPTGLDYQKFADNLRLKVGKEEAERDPVSYEAPEIPKNIPALRERAAKVGEAEIDPLTKRLMRQTGYSNDELKRFRVKHLVSHRVVNQTRMGKIQSIYYLAIAGNQRGLLGIGEGKSTETEDAMRQAKFAAIRNMQPIPRYEDRTIYGDIKVKVGAVELELMTRPPGKRYSHFTCQKAQALTVHFRFWYSMSIVHLRNVSLRRYI